uniref:Uncharacterized protein n=1 Tax=Arundo donax TaxID=35708 RepID=A0A0A9FKK6_ARUDO
MMPRCYQCHSFISTIKSRSARFQTFNVRCVKVFSHQVIYTAV